MDEALAACRRGYALARAGGDVDVTLDLLVQLCRLLESQGAGQDALIEASFGMKLIDRLRKREPVVNFLSYYAIVLANVGEIGSAFKHLRRAREIAGGGTALDRYRVAARFGETRILSGTPHLAIRDFRDAVEALWQASAGAKPSELTSYRFVQARVSLAQALLAAALASGEHGGPNTLEADGLLSVAATRVAEVPVLSVVTLTLLDLAGRLLGRPPGPDRVHLLATSPENLLASGHTDLDAVLMLVGYEARHGDLVFAETMLRKLDPTQLREVVPWRLTWFEIVADLQIAKGDHAGANETYRRYIRQARSDREHQLAIVAAVAEQAADVDEARRRERRAERSQWRERKRADRLAVEVSELIRVAAVDPLTKVANRRSLEMAVATISGDPQRSVFTVFLIDIDHFKSVNDEHSHLVGDSVLMALGELLTTQLRHGDFVARYGGEEFLVLACGHLQRAVLERLRLAIADHAWDRIAPGLAVTASLGAAVWRPGTAFADALAVADANMYAAKRAGRNQVVYPDAP